MKYYSNECQDWWTLRILFSMHRASTAHLWGAHSAWLCGAHHHGVSPERTPGPDSQHARSTARLPAAQEKRPSRGYASCSRRTWKPETRKIWLEVIRQQRAESLCDRNAAPVIDRSHRVPDCCHLAPSLGQGHSPHAGSASSISLTGSAHFRADAIFDNKCLYLFLCFHIGLSFPLIETTIINFKCQEIIIFFVLCQMPWEQTALVFIYKQVILCISWKRLMCLVNICSSFSLDSIRCSRLQYQE